MDTINALNKVANYLVLELCVFYKEDRIVSDNYQTALDLIEGLISENNIDSA